MATQTLGQIRIWRPWAGKTFMLDGQRDGIGEAATQTYTIGELVYFASGNVTRVGLAGAAPNQINTAILGTALQAGANLASAGGNPQVRIIHPGDIYIGNVYHTNAALAVTAQTDIGSVFGLYRTAAGQIYLDKINTVEGAGNVLGRVMAMGIPELVDGVTNTVADTYGFVTFRFLEYGLASDMAAGARLLQGWS